MTALMTVTLWTCVGLALLILAASKASDTISHAIAGGVGGGLGNMWSRTLGYDDISWTYHLSAITICVLLAFRVLRIVRAKAQ